MSVGDATNYLLFTNPVSASVWSVLGSVSKVAGLKPKNQNTIVASPAPAKIDMSQLPLWKLAGANLALIRVAAISGAGAVFLGAWGSHRRFPIDADDDKRDLKLVFETANRYHFFHTLALLAMPLARRPVVSGSLMIVGTTLFCGTLYYNSFTGDKRFNRLAPIGGVTLIIAWLSLII